MTLTRRKLLTTAGLLAGAPLLNKTAVAALVRSQQLSPAVLALTARTVGEVTAKIHLRTAVRGDMVNAADAIELLRQHLLETPFHGTLQAMAMKADPSQFDTGDIAKRAYHEVFKYDRAASLDEIHIPEDLRVGLNEIREHGLNDGLARISHGLRASSRKLPVAWPEPGLPGHAYGHLLRTQVDLPSGSDDELCEQAGFYINFLAGAIGVVALFGCTPEPAAFMICPIIGLLAGILGLVAFAQFVVC
jgi:hypothetical protein